SAGFTNPPRPSRCTITSSDESSSRCRKLDRARWRPSRPASRSVSTAGSSKTCTADVSATCSPDGGWDDWLDVRGGGFCRDERIMRGRLPRDPQRKSRGGGRDRGRFAKAELRIVLVSCVFAYAATSRERRTAARTRGQRVA